MGCDGGTIPKRDELVRTKKKPEQADKDAETVAKWKHCAITQEELKTPIVSCELGKLYTKDSVIGYLLDRSSASHDNALHIRNLRDIIELKLTPNPSFKKIAADKGDEYVDRQTSEYICPVTSIEMNGRYRFCFPRLCGCVLSERAFKEIKSDVCHRCGQSYDEDDLIVINGTKEDQDSLRIRMEERRMKAKLTRKAKKEAGKQTLDTKGEVAVEAKKIKLEPKAELSKKSGKKLVKQSGEAHSSNTNELNIRGLVASEEKLKQSYSVAKDVRASEAFKSLFTSHESCKNQQRAHWVTYNPLYN